MSETDKKIDIPWQQIGRGRNKSVYKQSLVPNDIGLQSYTETCYRVYYLAYAAGRISFDVPPKPCQLPYNVHHISVWITTCVEDAGMNELWMKGLCSWNAIICHTMRV